MRFIGFEATKKRRIARVSQSEIFRVNPDLKNPAIAIHPAALFLYLTSKQEALFLHIKKYNDILGEQ